MSSPSNSSWQLVRRVLVPFFIVAVPISAMVAFILYYHRASPPAKQTPTGQPLSFGSDQWPIGRGDAGLTGTAAGTLPGKLTVKWRHQTGGPIKSAPVVAQGIVYAASMDKHLYALDAEQGRLLWKFQADSELEAGPLWADGRVFAGSNKGTFYALDARTGAALWQFEGAGQIAGAANAAAISPDRRLIIFGSYDNLLYALDAQTGTLVFKHEAGSYINGSPAIADQIAIFGSCDGFIHCVPLDQARQPGTIEAGSYVAASPAVVDQTAYVGSYEGVFTAADIQTGKVHWRHSSRKEDPFFSSPAVNDTVAVVGCRDHSLYCFKRTDGTLLWTLETGDDLDSSPVICGDKIVIAGNDGRLYIVDLATGKELFSYTLGSPITSSPAIALNTVFIGCDNGLLFAFAAK